ncbi:MAG: energy-coupling factor ABC transporter permease [Rhodocyclaceae bacterium]|nr:energy-coupling factor ABC transporter permease [Rhodocyclaceae bacterium]MBX3670576.1 energy-coupling factor ABC transporter permease [Rhodocyclaceae bacterium]
MNFPATLFSGGWYLFGFAGTLAVLGWALWKAPWKWLADSRHLNVWLGAVVALALLWSMRAGVRPGLNLHLLGGMLLTLVAGRQLALIGLAMVLAAITFNGETAWVSFGLNYLVMAVAPVFAAWAIMTLVARRLPHHLFVYIFCNGFFGAALSVAAVGGASNAVLLLSGAYAFDFLLSEYAMFFLLLGFSEAWLTGMVVTLMVVYRPEWVSTFDDRIYLDNQ